MRNGDAAVAAVLEDLERVLVEIASSPSPASHDDLARWRDQIDTKGLLFKVTVMGSRVRERQQDAAARRARRRRPQPDGTSHEDHRSRIACTLAAFALIGSAAFAQGTSTPTTDPDDRTADAGDRADRRAAREGATRGAKPAKKASPPSRPPSTRRSKDVERAQKQIEQAQKQAQTQAQQDAAEEIAQGPGGAQGGRSASWNSTRKGTAALDTARYEKALQAFAEAAALKGAKADSALYWKAFSEYKVAGAAGRAGVAARRCRRASPTAAGWSRPSPSSSR